MWRALPIAELQFAFGCRSRKAVSAQLSAVSFSGQPLPLYIWDTWGKQSCLRAGIRPASPVLNAPQEFPQASPADQGSAPPSEV